MAAGKNIYNDIDEILGIVWKVIALILSQIKETFKILIGNMKVEMKNLPYLTHQDTFQITKNLHPKLRTRKSLRREQTLRKIMLQKSQRNISLNLLLMNQMMSHLVGFVTVPIKWNLITVDKQQGDALGWTCVTSRGLRTRGGRRVSLEKAAPDGLAFRQRAAP